MIENSEQNRREGINRIIGAGLRRHWGGEVAVRAERGVPSGAAGRSVSPVPYSVRRPNKLSPCHYYRVS
jgi:hypothetical protein